VSATVYGSGDVQLILSRDRHVVCALSSHDRHVVCALSSHDDRRKPAHHRRETLQVDISASGWELVVEQRPRLCERSRIALTEL
jgi:hypothetical protein